MTEKRLVDLKTKVENLQVNLGVYKKDRDQILENLKTVFGIEADDIEDKIEDLEELRDKKKMRRAKLIKSFEERIKKYER